MKKIALYLISFCLLFGSETIINAGTTTDTANGLPSVFNLSQNPEGTITISPPSNIRSFFAVTVTDVDNDGFNDIVAIGAKNYVSDNNYTPVIYIIYGNSLVATSINLNNPSLRTASIVWANNTDLRMRDIKVGDVNGDGLKEILFIGLPLGMIGGYEEVFAIPGRAVWQGETSFSESSQGVMKIYASIGAGFSSIMKQLQEYMISDFNGDGVNEVLLSYPMRQVRGYDYIGQMYIVKGGSQLSADVNAENHALKVTRIEGDTLYLNIPIGYDINGFSNFAIGDIDGDNKKDLVCDGGLNKFLQVTNSSQWDPSWKRPISWIVKGSVLTSKLYADSLFSLTDKIIGLGSLTNNMNLKSDFIPFIHTVYMGDINGDGYDDLFIGYPYEGGYPDGTAKAYILFGNKDFITTGNIDNLLQGKLNITAEAKGDQMGYNFACADINGDGYGDCLIASASNKFYVLYGRNYFPASIQLSSVFPYGSSVTGGSFVGCGDINNDGYQDIIGNGPGGIFIILGRGRTQPIGETIVRSLPSSSKSNYLYRFANGNVFRFKFSEGGPSDNTLLYLTNYGRSLPDSLSSIPTTSKVVSLLSVELTNIMAKYKVQCSIGYTDSLLNVLGIKEGNLTVSYWNKDNSRWAKIPTAVDSTLNLITFTTDHFSLFALIDKSDSVMTNVQEPVAPVPVSFELLQNYPNPFNPATTIQYNLPHGAQVKLSIYNILGQEVRALISRYQTAGEYKVEWNGTNNVNKPVAGGVYLYRLEAGGNVRVRKMVLMK